MATETATITEKFVELSHGKSRYLEAGSGYPTILMHGAGFLSGADNWLPVLPGLAERLHCYALDSLNWGPGDVFNQEFSFAYQVDHMREFMDALGTTGAFADVLSRQTVVQEDGTWRGQLEAYYGPPPDAAEPPQPSSEPGKTPGNTTPTAAVAAYDLRITSGGVSAGPDATAGGTPRDTRWGPSSGARTTALLYSLSAAAAVGVLLETVRVNVTSQEYFSAVPIVLDPGGQLTVYSQTANINLQVIIRWRERRLTQWERRSG